MNKLTLTLITTLACFSVTSCGDKNEENPQQEQPSGNNPSDHENSDTNTDKNDNTDAKSDEENTSDSKTDEEDPSDSKTDEEIKTCETGFTGDNCDVCAEGYYGLKCQPYGSVTDVDGNTYKTVVINNKEWMAENYRLRTGIYTYANNFAKDIQTYGLLYDWETATADNFCPNGWRLPTINDFDNLISFVGKNRQSESDFLALIAKSSTWNYAPNEGDDEFGFGAIPAGVGVYNNLNNSYTFYSYGIAAFYWSSTKNNANINEAHSFTLYSDDNEDKVIFGYDNKYDVLSVRCIKDL